MSIRKAAAQGARLFLTLLLIAGQVSTAQVHVIFPGEKLPENLTYRPLKLGTDVQLTARDWFMLKDPALAIANPTPGKSVEVSGPILDNNNAQAYFRLISGMILKESMIRMGMNPSQAQRFLEAAAERGADVNTTPLEQLGPLPKGLAELYENWHRPVHKMAVLPYLLLPLSVAMDQSGLQHFALAGVEDKVAQKTCSTITSVYPLAPVHNRLVERGSLVESLTTDLRNANARLQQSNIEQVRMTHELRQYSGQIDGSLTCFATITERVSRGGSMPAADCLQMAQTVLENAKLGEEWTRFTAKNLRNENGDFTDRQKADERLKSLEARLSEVQTQIQTLTDTQALQTREQADAREKIAKLNGDLAAQKTEEERATAEKAQLQNELMGIQNLNHALETGAFAGSDSEKQAAILATTVRAQRMAQIRTRLSQILQTEVKFQINQAAIVRQIEFLTSLIDQRKASLEAIHAQLSEPTTGLDARAASLSAQVKEATAVYLRVLDEAKFSEYVLSVLNRKLSNLAKSRDDIFGALKREEALAETYKKQIADAQKALDAQAPGLNREISDLEAMIASYKDINNMGWFLETDCAARANFSGDKAGIYLSRARITAPSGASAASVQPRSQTQTRAQSQTRTQPQRLAIAPGDAGKWGLFNMDYNVFKAAIQNGVLLNVAANVQMAVQQIVDNYDFAIAHQLDAATQKCAETDGGRSQVGSAMRIASVIWHFGNDAQARARAVACRPAQASAESQSAAANPAREYMTTLGRLVAFEGSVLDVALPKAGQSHAKDQIERDAIVHLGRELAPLAGFNRRAAGDRDVLIKALIQILATDYNAEARKLNGNGAETARTEFVFASVAPGGSFTASLVAGQEYTLNTLAAIPLYVQPVAESRYASGLTVSLRDRVQVLSTVRAGWVKVQFKGRELWMAARPLASKVLTDEADREINGFQTLSNCDQPRLVTLRARGRVERFANNLRTFNERNGTVRIDTVRSARVAPAAAGKTYLSCESFQLSGQVAALRLVEVQVLKARNGETLYLPIEDVGGFVVKNQQVVEGDLVDPVTWSVK